ncbi:hypothetical protein [Rubrivirga sp. IMCC45206]|uniref:hypothetical protein n=1 Tax=Rubrivirga sp. IMCC45206 TaxID=3391614 RepID=UPI003990392F
MADAPTPPEPTTPSPTAEGEPSRARPEPSPPASDRAPAPRTPLDTAATVATIVSSLAVVVGLVFVAIELRQNTLAQRVTATQTLVVDYETAVDLLAKTPESACIYVRGNSGLDNLTGIERYQYFVMWFHLLRSAEQLHYYSLEGMVDARIWRGFQRQLDEVMRYPGVYQYWEQRRHWYSDEFQAFVDQIFDRAPIAAPVALSEEGCDDL